VELHDEYITSVRICEILETRFGVIETVQRHCQISLEVKQGKDEDILSFSDRVKFLAQKTFPSAGDPTAQSAYHLV
jgi:hypothetical protein